MKILIVMDPGISIPVKGYGGHERLVEMFAKSYHKKGHEVHLLVTSGSTVEGCTVHDFGKEGFPPSKMNARYALINGCIFLWKYRNNFDLVHNFGRLAYLIPILNCRVKKIMTYGREISSRNIKWINKLPTQNLVFTGCSKNLVSRGAVAGKWKAVYNAVEFNLYTLQKKIQNEAPLIFLGRLERIKGLHTAIRLAINTGNNLIIAGNISPLSDEKKYYENELKPLIDGKQIKYIGAVNDSQKNEWLGKSKALLFPIEWDEPFGIVMVEAMACGTPVIGFKRGSVPEVINEDITGYIVSNEEEMKTAILKINLISREECRNAAKNMFDVDIISDQYLNLFQLL